MLHGDLSLSVDKSPWNSGRVTENIRRLWQADTISLDDDLPLFIEAANGFLEIALAHAKQTADLLWRALVTERQLTTRLTQFGQDLLTETAGSLPPNRLQAQADLAIFDTDDFDLNFITYIQDIFWEFDTFLADLGNVYKSGKSVFQTYKCTVVLEGFYGSGKNASYFDVCNFIK